MVPETASRPSMSAVQIVSPQEDAFAERWRQWQLANAATSRVDARRARTAFIFAFAALAVWLGRLLLAQSL